MSLPPSCSSSRWAGLSGQESAKRAVWYGIVGMALAVAATLYRPGCGQLADRVAGR
jgi:NAD/NADP transhydrogenase beta subunit